jgi:hypothetical protein
MMNTGLAVGSFVRLRKPRREYSSGNEYSFITRRYTFPRVNCMSLDCAKKRNKKSEELLLFLFREKTGPRKSILST